ncbi:uncharacterized protein LOC143681257 [Tamandua tetradactyla]|uniref:uncharacterized protein LOC143681257 n=1 Tax=Tamandua tetradactyla TaxID=48850 RepID=UPI0040545A48
MTTYGPRTGIVESYGFPPFSYLHRNEMATGKLIGGVRLRTQIEKKRVGRRGSKCSNPERCDSGSMAEFSPIMLETWVRFPVPAHVKKRKKKCLNPVYISITDILSILNPC